MSSKLENVLPLFISASKWVGVQCSLQVLHLIFFNKVKGRYVSQSEPYILKKLSSLKNAIMKLALL